VGGRLTVKVADAYVDLVVGMMMVVEVGVEDDVGVKGRRVAGVVVDGVGITGANMLMRMMLVLLLLLVMMLVLLVVMMVLVVVMVVMVVMVRHSSFSACPTAVTTGGCGEGRTGDGLT
jgi:hypothetical protein